MLSVIQRCPLYSMSALARFYCITQSESLIKPKSRLDIRKNFFSCRVIDPWNDLPPGVQGAADVLDFKMQYDSFITGN